MTFQSMHMQQMLIHQKWGNLATMVGKVTHLRVIKKRKSAALALLFNDAVIWNGMYL